MVVSNTILKLALGLVTVAAKVIQFRRAQAILSLSRSTKIQK